MNRQVVDMARELFLKHGRSDRALEELLCSVMKDKSMVKEAVRIFCLDAIQLVIRDSRRELERGREVVVRVRENDPEYQRALQDASLERKMRYMGWILTDGTYLKDADRDRLAKEVAFYRAQTLGCMRHGMFLQSIMESMKEGKTVKECYTESDLERIMRNVGVQSERALSKELRDPTKK